MRSGLASETSVGVSVCVEGASRDGGGTLRGGSLGCGGWAEVKDLSFKDEGTKFQLESETEVVGRWTYDRTNPC